MTEPPLPRPAPPSNRSLLGAILLGIVGLCLLLSASCFGLFGIVFISDGQGVSAILLLISLALALGTFFILRLALKLSRGTTPPPPAQAERVEEGSAVPDEGAREE